MTPPPDAIPVDDQPPGAVCAQCWANGVPLIADPNNDGLFFCESCGQAKVDVTTEG